jgi:predicted CoA-binding protein
MNKTTLLIGASPKKERYSNKAMNLLAEKGHTVIPVNPAFDEIDGISTIKNVEDLNSPIHTVTLYVNPKRLEPMVGHIIAAEPKRIIFNPGTESDEIEKRFNENGISTLKACTLVMLNTGQY